MELFKDCKGYATRANAVKKLESVCKLEGVRWFVVTLPTGRYMPVVHATGSDRQAQLIGLAWVGIAVI